MACSISSIKSMIVELFGLLENCPDIGHRAHSKLLDADPGRRVYNLKRPIILRDSSGEDFQVVLISVLLNLRLDLYEIAFLNAENKLFNGSVPEYDIDDGLLHCPFDQIENCTILNLAE